MGGASASRAEVNCSTTELTPLSIMKRQLQGLNMRGQSPPDFKSDSLTTRTN
ncbi:hypothetical protein H8356DRAFT_1330650 [Neocallimastix lanati (nom. inval.)]|nr:hypothetical protein H8356DRAFT_1330650 [Neocallimastix sp. JGI-2020a]